MENENKRLQFDTVIGGYEKINPEFAKVKIHILYEGKNRNGSYFSKETIEKMIPTLFNTPVVGEWSEENQNFKGHGGKLEISDDGWKFIDTTRPYGVVPSDTTITWERIREKDGITEHDYLTCFAYLWYGRYPEIEKILDDGCGQSMEVSVHDADWNEELDVYEIKDANFSALCILGKDSDPDKHYEPCFESADIEHFELTQEKFKNDFNEMINTLKMSLQPKKEDEKLDEKLALFEKYTNIDSTIIEELKANLDNYTLEELDAKLEELGNVEFKEDETLDDEQKEKPINYEAVVEELNNKIKEFETTVSELNNNINTLTEKYNVLEVETKELREYKANVECEKLSQEKEAVFSEYAMVLTDEEMNPIKEKVSEYSLDDIRNALNTIIVNKNFELIKLQSKDKPIEKEIPMDFQRKSTSKSKYAVS